MPGYGNDEGDPALAVESPHTLVEFPGEQHLAIEINEIILAETECGVIDHAVKSQRHNASPWFAAASILESATCSAACSVLIPRLSDARRTSVRLS